METTSTLPFAVNNWYDRALLDRLLPLLVHDRWAQIRDIPKNNTNVAKFRKYNSLSPNTTPLNEGITPAGTNLSITDVTATVLQYGDYITLSDWLVLTTLDPVLLETATVLGEQAGKSLDIVTRDIINAGTHVSYVQSRTERGDVEANDSIEAADITGIVDSFKADDVQKITRMVSPHRGYETRPVNDCYVAINHPDVSRVIKGLTDFVPIEKYASNADVMPGEYGKYDDVRFVETSNAKVFEGEGSGDADVYSTIFLGQDAYGTTKIAGTSVENIVKAVGTAGTNDPLNQRATSGWKANKTAVILNQLCIRRLESGI